MINIRFATCDCFLFILNKTQHYVLPKHDTSIIHFTPVCIIIQKVTAECDLMLVTFLNTVDDSSLSFIYFGLKFVIIL